MLIIGQPIPGAADLGASAEAGGIEKREDSKGNFHWEPLENVPPIRGISGLQLQEGAQEVDLGHVELPIELSDELIPLLIIPL